MILTALKELAEKEGLVKNPDYQPFPVRWVLTIGPGGALLGPMRDTLTKPRSGKGKATSATFDVPKRSKRTAQDFPEFLVDKAEYVFGWVEEPEQAERGKRRHRLYVEELSRAFEQTRDEALGALLAFFQAFEKGELSIQRPEGMTSGDWLGFAYSADPDGPRLISSRPSVVNYWSARRRERERGLSTAEKCENKLQCLVTGVPCIPVRLHPKIKNVPPVSETKGGVPFTSTDKDSEAFHSYGLQSFSCAVVSQEAADGYEKALNRLLAVGYPSPVDGTALPVRHFRLSEATVVTFWSRGPEQVVDLFADSVGQGQPEAVEALYRATWKGRPVNLDDPAAFYALTLSGGQGRGTIRGWLESTLAAALSNVRDYFNDLFIVHPTGEEKRALPLLKLLERTAVKRKKADGRPYYDIPPHFASDVFQAVLLGRPFPRMLLDAAVRRTRLEREQRVIRFDEQDRFALIKAYLLRARRANLLTSSFPEVKPMLDEECPHPAYRLGRLFAVLEKVQADATNASTTIRDRYYGAASATPVVVFPQLLRKAPHHLAKLDAATFYEKLIQSICCALQPPTPFPTTLSLEEQGLFAVGYYHQRQALFTKRDVSTNSTTQSQGV